VARKINGTIEFVAQLGQHDADLRFDPREGMYTTLLMSTGLTFGSISALFGLTNHIIDERQYTILTAVIGSAVVPTIIAERWFQPVFKALTPASPAKPGATSGVASRSKTGERRCGARRAIICTGKSWWRTTARRGR
jgi:hypothetical protein